MIKGARRCFYVFVSGEFKPLGPVRFVASDRFGEHIHGGSYYVSLFSAEQENVPLGRY